MKKVITFGELLLRLSPPGYQRFVQTENYNAAYGGAEANVAILLANLGLQSTFVTKLPNHEVGQAGVNTLQRFGVNTNQIVRGGERVGIYFLETGASQRPSKVIYDRAGSSFAKSKACDYDWDAIFQDASWFHFSGITPALSEELENICLEALQAAKKRGITVSCDLNYRKNLWTVQKASSTMRQYMEYVDVLIANEEHVRMILGIGSNKTDPATGELVEEGYQEITKQLMERFHFQTVAITMRRSINANHNRVGALICQQDTLKFSKMHDVQIVDRVGSGDSFSGGLIYAMLCNYDLAYALDFAVASYCLKHSIVGDYNIVTVNEIEQLAKGDGSGRVQR